MLTLADTTNASCQGYRNVPIPSNQFFAVMTWGGTVLIDNQGSFDFEGDTFTRIGTSNSFAGSYTASDGSNEQMRFDLISSTSMGGQLIGNATYNGVPCSATVLFSARFG